MSNEEKEEPKPRKKDFPIKEYRLLPAEQFEVFNEEDDIDLIELFKKVWENRTIVYKFIAIGALLGILVALLSPKEYKVTATLMPEYSTESQSGANSLLREYGGLIGLSGGGTYNSSSNAIRVDLYPQIVSSLTFQDKLAQEEFYFVDYDTTVSIYEYYLKIQSPGFLGMIKKYTLGLPTIFFKKQEREQELSAYQEQDGIVRLNEAEMKVIETLRSRVGANLDEESGIISVSVKMRDPELAATIAKYTIEELTEYLISYRTEKVLRDLTYIEKQLETAESRFEEALYTLAEFRDSNQGTLTARARTEEQRLNSVYDVAFNLYNTLTQQFEEAKLKVQEETPVFKVLQPVQVPVNDETSGAMVLFIFLFMSGFASVCWISLKHFFGGDFSFEKRS